jgi:hypothetical protein
MAYPRLTIALHLDPDEIARRYRACDNPVERFRWLMSHAAAVKGAVGFGWAAALEPS